MDGKQTTETKPDQPSTETLTTLNDRSEAFLDEFISRVNGGRNVTMLLTCADNLWFNLKEAREAAGRPAPKL